MAVTAILFPGQGSQTPEMRDTVAEVRPDLLSLAEQIVGEDPFARAEEGTRFAQPAIFCASLAGWEALGRPAGEFMAGHSLGELAALVAAGRLGERDGLELVALRGKLMQESGERAGDGGMVALMGRAPRSMPMSWPTPTVCPWPTTTHPSRSCCREIGLDSRPRARRPRNSGCGPWSCP